MRAAALIVLGLTLLIAADLTQTCAERVREYSRRHIDNQVQIAVEDWKYGSYFTVGLGLGAAGWLTGLGVSRQRRASLLVIPTVRASLIGAVFGGVALPVGFAAWSVAAGEVEHEAQTRYGWEMLWLLGSAIGAVAGMAIGAGLGMIAFVRRSHSCPPGPSAGRSEQRTPVPDA